MLLDRSNIIWIGTNSGLNQLNTKSWQLEPMKFTDREMPNRILFPTEIKQNSRGEIWMVENNFLSLLDSAKREMKYVTLNKIRININAFCFDKQNHIIAVNNQGEMYFVNTRTFEARKYNVDLSPTKIFGIYLINNILWISTDGYGLQRFTTDGQLIDKYFTNSDNPDYYSNRIREVLQTSDGRIWIATYKGLIEWQEGNFNQYFSDFEDQFSLPDNSIMSLLEDRQNGLWIGTWRGGLGYLNSFANTFETYLHSPYKNSICGNLVNAISENADGTLMIGTDGQGIDVFNEQRKIFRHVELKENKKSSTSNVKCIFLDKKGNTWVGTYSEGVYLKKFGQSNFEHFILKDKNVYDIVEDEDGIWIATSNSGLYFYRHTDRSIQHFVNQPSDSLSLLSNTLRKLCLDPKGNLWVISNLGVSIKPKGKNIFERLELYNETGKSPTQVYSITGEKNGQIWLGTDHGLFYVDKSLKVTHYQVVFNGNPVSVYGIVVTDPSSIWMSTNYGIFSFNPVTGRKLNYNNSDGLHGNLFNAGALCQTSSGKIYFGSTAGLVAFNPKSMHVNPFQPKVYFSRIFVNHKEILPGQDNSLLKKPLYETSLIRLKPGYNSFGIEFVAQNYLNPQKNQFRYRLKNFDPNWVDAGSLNKATYTNIPPGNYVFEAMACNNDMVWSMEPSTLKIIIPRPLLLSNLAISIYLILLIILGIMIRRIVIFRTRLVHQIEIERLQRLEEEKSHQNKLNFFTNISHELRTPLTLITGPVETLISAPGIGQDTFNQLSLIKRNSGRLLKLINQLLEFRQIEENKTEFKVIKADLVLFVHEIHNYFIDVAKQKNINYVFLSLQDQLILSFDAEKIDKVVFNLLSNAFKFTPERGTIHVEISSGQKNNSLPNLPNVVIIGELKTKNFVQITVSDNGPGIASHLIEKVFDRFFRIENHEIPHSGTGIGLHLTKYLVLLHGGEIELESEVDKGSIFRVRLPYIESIELENQVDKNGNLIPANHPLHEESFLNENQNLSFVENWNNRGNSGKKSEKLVLVVEDHQDLSNFICNILAEEYRIIPAFTGIEGIEKARIFLPDLIISDILMPGKSGIDLVNELKNDLKTSHIPIILLTALTSVENKIEGFASGADDYLEKPFNREVLKSRLKNIFANRILLQEYYSKKISIGFDKDIPETPDKKMMATAIKYVESNLTDERMDTELLANHLNLSQSTLYRKLKSLTGKSATDFIRTIRLEYAARLFREGMFNIEEVSAMSGFNSHSYFSRSFKEQFGKTPSEYLHDLKSKN